MASTRKSSRVRVPKIREDAATPQKRSKTNAPTVTSVVAATIPPVATPVVQPPTLVMLPSAAVPTAAVDVISVPVSLEAGVGASAEEVDLNAMGLGEGGEEMAVEKVATAIFKKPGFVHSSIGAAGSKRTRVWKNLKQITSSERSLPWQNTDVTYGLIEGPPSFKPAKKYSDLSGFEAAYTDPQTKLRFASPEEYNRARTLPSDLVTGYLNLRKASAPVP